MTKKKKDEVVVSTMELNHDKETVKETTGNIIGYAKDNDGNEMLEHPLEAFGDMVIIENISKSATSAMEDYNGLKFDSEIGEHQEIGGWRVVAKGEFVKRVDIGDLVGQPIGNSITPVLHPQIAKRVQITDKNGYVRTATKEDYDYVYAVVNMNLIGMRYK